MDVIFFSFRMNRLGERQFDWVEIGEVFSWDQEEGYF